MSAESKIAGDRISAAQLARIEAEYHHGAVARSMMREIRAAWGEVEAATRQRDELVVACRALVAEWGDYEHPGSLLARSLLRSIESADAARALVGSENRKADDG